MQLASVLCLVGLLASCPDAVEQGDSATPTRGEDAQGVLTQSVAPKARTSSASLPIVRAARAQVGKTVVYDSAYVGLAYPGGDVPLDRGVCTDVVVRAFRDALGVDLQQRVHDDMTAAFSEYPRQWGLDRPDPNIDHRRVPNLRRYFERQGWALAVTDRKGDYLPGDLVTCTVPRNRPHIMIVSDRTGPDGVPYVIHNIGRGAREEDRLFEFPLTGHYRIESEDSGQRAP